MNNALRPGTVVRTNAVLGSSEGMLEAADLAEHRDCLKIRQGNIEGVIRGPVVGQEGLWFVEHPCDCLAVYDRQEFKIVSQITEPSLRTR